MKYAILSLACGVTLALAGCDGDDDGGDDAAETGAMEDTGAATGPADGSDSGGGGEAIDEDAELARAAGYASSFTRINATDFPSQHGLAATVNVWVSSEGVAAYEALDPANPADPAIPEGSMLLKQHLDTDGNDDGYLVMVKGPEGYAPDAGDWWWARVDGSGAPQETGQVGFCIACHAGQAPDSDFVIGVPLDNRL